MAEAFNEELYDFWANLPLEISSLIQLYFTRERDYNILRFICKSWRCIFVLHRQSPFHIDNFRLRFLLLMSSHGHATGITWACQAHNTRNFKHINKIT